LLLLRGHQNERNRECNFEFIFTSGTQTRTAALLLKRKEATDGRADFLLARRNSLFG